MARNARVPGTSLPVATFARPDYPGNRAAKRRELVRRNDEISFLRAADISLTLFYSRRYFEDLMESRGFPLDETQVINFEIAH
jgi:hypothetical protein